MALLNLLPNVHTHVNKLRPKFKKKILRQSDGRRWILVMLFKPSKQTLFLFWLEVWNEISFSFFTSLLLSKCWSPCSNERNRNLNSKNQKRPYRESPIPKEESERDWETLTYLSTAHTGWEFVWKGRSQFLQYVQQTAQLVELSRVHQSTLPQYRVLLPISKFLISKISCFYSEKHYSFQIDLNFFTQYEKQNNGYDVVFTAVNINTLFVYEKRKKLFQIFISVELSTSFCYFPQDIWKIPPHSWVYIYWTYSLLQLSPSDVFHLVCVCPHSL